MRSRITLFTVLTVAIFVCAYTPLHVSAQGTQSLSVTPPLFQLTAAPNDSWQSSIKVVNNNTYPLTVYPEVVHFVATGEAGQGRFIPVVRSEDMQGSLAEWISISNGPYTIEPESTEDISFVVSVPENAPPGGHYAAILISTKAPKSDGTLSVLTSQAVTSLFFMRIEGEIEEAGTIRSFAPVKSFLQKPEVELSLRFENKGNVHVQPRGTIIVRNMWGTERGTIPVNYQTHFGNVLPKSIRNFTFVWKSDFEITDIGRYTAEAILAYGEDGIKSITAETHFWIIPVKGTMITLLVIVLFIVSIVYIVKAYVRRMLALAGVSPAHTRTDNGDVPQAVDETTLRRSPLKIQRAYTRVSAPIRSGVLDLRERLRTKEESQGVLYTIFQFVRSYKVFFISMVILITIFISTVVYITGATKEGKSYEYTVKEEGV